MQKKMTIEEAARFFNISKEAIHNRIRRGTLKATLIDGVKYVNIDSSSHKPSSARSSKTTSSPSEQFHNYLQEQNRALTEKVNRLEQETRNLREEKERLLIEERKRIEQIYIQKDEQLKAILGTITSQFLLEPKQQPDNEILHEEEHLEAEIEETPKKREPSKKISLKKYLKKADITKKKRKKIVSKVLKIATKEKRFLKKKGKLYVFPDNYSYKDILQ